MTDEAGSIIEQIRATAASGALRFTIHAAEEMVADGITTDDVLDAIASGKVLEDYPEHRRGPCCLVWGTTRRGGNVHVVCTTGRPLVVITAYIPQPPKFPTPEERSTK